MRTGLNPSFTSANADGHTLDNSAKDILLYVKNGAGSPINVTITTPGTVDGLAVADRVVAVPATGERVIGPFPRGTYGSSVSVAFSSVTSVTVALLTI